MAKRLFLIFSVFAVFFALLGLKVISSENRGVLTGARLTRIIEFLRAGRDGQKPTPVISPLPTLTPIPERKPASKNPFGVMFANKDLTATAKTLGVVYYRPNSVFVEGWNKSCPECDAAVQNGLKLILTIRNNGGRGQPTTPPQDYPAFKKTVAEVVKKYEPTILVVENEENSQSLFYRGTPEEYHRELKAACEAAHANSTPCANGGLVSSLVALMIANSYREEGQEAKADEYLKRTLRTDLYDQFKKSGGFSSAQAKQQIEQGKALFVGYKDAGADFINFHWYIADVPALAEAVLYLEKTTGLKAMTNEIGQQRNEDPEQVRTVMQKIVDLNLPYAVWFSVDVPGYGEARSLLNPDGNLRPNGQAFHDFVDQAF